MFYSIASNAFDVGKKDNKVRVFYALFFLNTY